MRFLTDERLYRDTEYCLRFLRELKTSTHDDAAAGERYHLYWYGPFSRKQAFAVKSLLATQEVKPGEVWLWLDAEDGYADHQRNAILRPFAQYLSVRPFDPLVECRGTPLEDRPELYEGGSPVDRSDFFRWVMLYKHGGVYLDMDMMLLRDMGELFRQPFLSDEFCYRWSADQTYANTAVLRLRRRSETAHAILARCVEAGTGHPSVILRFDDNERLDFTVLPCPFFDPLWPHRDRMDRFEGAPFDGFEGFFREFGGDFRPSRSVHSYREFFPGAFAFHWHNQWDAPEHDSSYFGRFDREFDELLGSRGPRRAQ